MDYPPHVIWTHPAVTGHCLQKVTYPQMLPWDWQAENHASGTGAGQSVWVLKGSRLAGAADGVSLSAQESERLELMNAELKTQIEELKLERQQLILMLNRHRPTCIVRTDSVRTPESEGNPLLEQLDKK